MNDGITVDVHFLNDGSLEIMSVWYATMPRIGELVATDHERWNSYRKVTDVIWPRTGKPVVCLDKKPFVFGEDD